MRICSLVPSLTELVCDLGMGGHLVGRTGFCIHPAAALKKVQGVGGSKDPSLEKIKALKPDRILVNSEENRPEDISELKSLAPVLETFPGGPLDVPAMIRETGRFLGSEPIAENLAVKTEEALHELGEVVKGSGVKTGSFVYFIWIRPWMAVGKDTYISRMLEYAGWQNALKSVDRYPVVDPKNIASLAPDVCFFSTEPWPFRLRDLKSFKEEWPEVLLPLPRILKADGRLMSWYGSSTITCLEEWLRFHRQKSQKLVREF